MKNLAEIDGKRAEYLVELFLEQTDPAYFAQAESPNLPFDFIIGWKSDDLIRNFAVEVKHSTKEIRPAFRFMTTRQAEDYLSNSDIPVILFAVNPKTNEIFYNLMSEAEIAKSTKKRGCVEISLPVALAAEPKAFLRDILSRKRSHVVEALAS